MISELVGQTNQGYIFKSNIQRFHTSVKCVNKICLSCVFKETQNVKSMTDFDIFVMFVNFHYVHKVSCNDILMLNIMVFVLTVIFVIMCW